MRLSRTQFKTARSKWVVYPTVILTMLNFFAFVAGSIHFGGDALNGYVRGGEYFVCAHGSCSQVSRAIWQYSYTHALSAIGGFVLLAIEYAIFVRLKEIVFDAERPT